MRFFAPKLKITFPRKKGELNKFAGFYLKLNALAPLPMSSNLRAMRLEGGQKRERAGVRGHITKTDGVPTRWII